LASNQNSRVSPDAAVTEDGLYTSWFEAATITTWFAARTIKGNVKAKRNFISFELLNCDVKQPFLSSLYKAEQSHIVLGVTRHPPKEVRDHRRPTYALPDFRCLCDGH
jgi:hypothetical protein